MPSVTAATAAVDEDDGVLQIDSPTATLIVTATDIDGNETICELDLCAACPADDDDTDDDDTDDGG